MADDEVVIRPLATREDCEAGVQLQRAIWGADFVDVVPATILMVTQRVGGVAAGAFDGAGRLVGFVFGMSGVRDGVSAHWSDMLAVRPAYRGRGLGRRLKEHQRERLLACGVERVYWSFDPLVCRNASLNLSALGATAVEFVSDMYGNTASVLHQGLDTDRLIVEWRLTDSRVLDALAGQPHHPPDEAKQGSVLVTDPAQPPPTTPTDWPWVRLELPDDLDTLKATRPSDARRWQRRLRDALTTLLNHQHHRVDGLYQDTTSGRWYYTVDRRGQSG